MRKIGFILVFMAASSFGRDFLVCVDHNGGDMACQSQAEFEGYKSWHVEANDFNCSTIYPDGCYGDDKASGLTNSLCFHDWECMPNQHCAIGGSGAGECRDNPVVGECRSNDDCSWPKMCIGWYCR